MLIGAVPSHEGAMPKTVTESNVARAAAKSGHGLPLVSVSAGCNQFATNVGVT